MASACILIECPITGMILGVSRKDDVNAWGLPGGKVEERDCPTCTGAGYDAFKYYCPSCKNARVVPAETEAEAAVRELRQETGLVYPRHYLRECFRREGGVTFEASIFHGDRVEDIDPSETGRVAWVTPEQLLAGPFGDYNRRLLVHIGRIE